MGGSSQHLKDRKKNSEKKIHDKSPFCFSALQLYKYTTIESETYCDSSDDRVYPKSAEKWV